MRTTAFALALVVGAVTACSDPGSATRSPDQTATLGAPEPSTSTPSPSPSPTPTATATASPSPIPQAVGTYLALGDSLAVGVGATRPEELGYVARITAALSRPDAMLQVAQLRNLAVGGETSGSMITGGQLAAGLDAVRTAEPPVALVTLDIGGNDLLRLLGTEACASAPLGAECQQLLALTLADFEANYRQIVGELRAALADHAPEAVLGVMTYFNPFSGTDAAYEAAGERALLGGDLRLDCQAADPASRGMNDIIACVGEELGAVAVDVQPRFASLGLELTHIGSEDIHANDRGYEVIAESFLEELLG